MPSNPFDIFIVHCVFTNAYVGDGYINYRFDHFNPKDQFPLRIANTVIEENDLPLKAKIIGLPIRYILQITEK